MPQRTIQHDTRALLLAGLAAGLVTYVLSQLAGMILSDGDQKAFLSFYSEAGPAGFSLFSVPGTLLVGVVTLAIWASLRERGYRPLPAFLVAYATPAAIIMWVFVALVIVRAYPGEISAIAKRCSTDLLLLAAGAFAGVRIAGSWHTSSRDRSSEPTTRSWLAALAIGASVVAFNQIVSARGTAAVLGGGDGVLATAPPLIDPPMLLQAAAAGALVVWTSHVLAGWTSNLAVRGLIGGMVVWLLGWFWGLGQSMALGALPGPVGIVNMAFGLLALPIAGVLGVGVLHRAFARG